MGIHRSTVIKDDDKLEHRAVIEFFVKEGCPAANVHGRLEKLYEGDVIDVNNVRRRVKRFKNEETDKQGKQRSGRPATAVTEETRQADDLIRANRCMTVKSCLSSNMATMQWEPH